MKSGAPLPKRAAASTGGKLAGTAGARAASLAMTAIATTLIMRRLGPSVGGGYYVLITIATTAVSLGHLSLTHAFVYLWAREDDHRSFGANAMGLGLSTGVLSGLLCWCVVYVLGPSVVPLSDRYGLLGVALVAVPPSIVALYLSTLLALGDRIGRVNSANVIGAAAPCGLIIALYVSRHLTLRSAVAVWVLFSLVPAFLIVGGVPTSRRYLSSALAVESLKIGCQYHLATVALFLLLRVDVFILNARVSKAEVGLYALAVALAELTFVFSDSLAQVILPRQVGGTIAEAGEYTALIMRTSLVVAALATIAILAFAPVVVRLFVGEAFSGSVSAMFSLAPGIVAFATIRTLGGVLVRLNRPIVVSGATMMAMVVNVVLNLVLIPRFGIVGAGLASSIAYSLLAAFHTAWLLRAASLGAVVLRPRLSDFGSYVASLRSVLSSGQGGKVP